MDKKTADFEEENAGTRGAVVKVEVSEDDVEGHLIFQNLLLICGTQGGPPELSAPLQQHVQLLTAHRRITWERKKDLHKQYQPRPKIK